MRAHDEPQRTTTPPHRNPPHHRPTPPAGPAAAIIALHRQAGNTAVTRAIQRLQPHTDPDRATDHPRPVRHTTVHDVLRTPGTPISEPLRHDMEARLGADFSDVRLHTGALAERSARELGARAYTSGNHIVLGPGGTDRHTLAHELTHVIQQRTGPVTGTDNGHGLRVSDPGDAYERAAEANAARALAAPRPEAGPVAAGGETGVQRAAEAEGTVPRGSPVPIQRWVWVGNRRIRSDDPIVANNDNMKRLVEDQLVHDYLSENEFADHAAGNTDHIGNLSGFSQGTWVRFEPSGTNVIGETHTEVTLRDVLTAVRSSSFRYEAFSVDELPPNSKMSEAYEASTQELFNQMPTGGVTDKREFAADSLFPKTGETLAVLKKLLADGQLDALGDGRYFGKTASRYLKIAWGYGKDVEAEASTFDRFQRVAKAKETALAESVTKTKSRLDGFITSLAYDSYLGDAINALGDPDSAARRDILADLQQFCQAFIDAALARPRTDLPVAGRMKVEAMARKPGSDPEKVFLKWRDLHFAEAVAKAVRDGVRYVGMGQDHLTELETKRRLPAGSRAYYLGSTGGAAGREVGRDIIEFERNTRRRLDEVEKERERTTRATAPPPGPGGSPSGSFDLDLGPL
ncbi:DUF4157 domain-containing protein [Micromonospora sp. HM5-17]|uniref:eCIS core domain-containing protein n=1 Tax=Micromonospora sp. HM5-17 TaxID=2487710 RepID=UPI000F4831BB|nr:DUF4157 domain-containing protein [Micromonospora sp. HM5-17]ROT29441.1 DUF4157 domain-containing protein [Micromonospora sp. HM5-17]